MTRPNEPLRAWALHVAYALTAAAAAAPVGVGVLAVINLGPILGTLIAVVLAVTIVGTAAWWANGKTRP